MPGERPRRARSLCRTRISPRTLRPFVHRQFGRIGPQLGKRRKGGQGRGPLENAKLPQRNGVENCCHHVGKPCAACHSPAQSFRSQTSF